MQGPAGARARDTTPDRAQLARFDAKPQADRTRPRSFFRLPGLGERRRPHADRDDEVIEC